MELMMKNYVSIKLIKTKQRIIYDFITQKKQNTNTEKNVL